MAGYADFSNYGVDPWSGIELNERPWYDPVLRDIYYRSSVYSQNVTMKVDLNGPKARTITFNDLIPPRPNIAPIQPRQMEATRLYSDSFQRSVDTERYGNGMSLHRESEMFNYWMRNGATAGLLGLIQASLGQVIVDHMDLLARNAYFSHPYALMGLNNASGFNGITDSDKMNTDLVDEVWLSLRDREKPYSALPVTYATGEESICITTAGAIYDLKREVGTGAGGLNFVDVQKYTESGRTQLIAGELGMWRGTRFVDNPLAKLWNQGTISHQTTIKAAVKPGSGAPDPKTEKVEGTRMVGQPSAVHYIRVQDASGFVAGDKITIHSTQHDADTLATEGYRGVLNGPSMLDPMRQDVEIHRIDTSGGAGNHKVILKEPYMMTGDAGSGLETDLGSGVYGFMTKAATIHSALFLTPGMSNNALVAGVAQPPAIYQPPAFDDYLSVFRISYDFWMKYALWDARAYHLAFLKGANSLIGKRITR